MTCKQSYAGFLRPREAEGEAAKPMGSTKTTVENFGDVTKQNARSMSPTEMLFFVEDGNGRPFMSQVAGGGKG